jgi:hypothetical protein
MIRSIPSFGAALSLVLTAGCAAHPEPIVDLKGIDPEVFQRDLEECEAYADQVSIGEAAAKSAAVGAVIGAATGAIGGAAGEGAGYGGIYGATSGGLNAEREKQIVFARCLEGRGYRVLNSYAHSRPYHGYPHPVYGSPYPYPVHGTYEVFESL